MAYRIRKLKDTDAIAVCELAKQLNYELETTQFLGRLSQLGQNESHALWVMESPENEVCAWAHFEKSLSLLGIPRLEIRALVVDQKVRRKGLAKRMMLFAESFARTEDLNQVYLSCNVNRVDAHEFYQAVGYQRLKTSHIFIKNI